MLNLGLFRQPAFVAATVAALTTGAGVIALMSYLSGFLVLVLGLTALEAATPDAAVGGHQRGHRPARPATSPPG